ncbi:hypothetical protein ACG3QZ_04145 [Pseudomonas aeruginosa]|uniref:hypothetical protein n=1 Tax=Pseudomonas aeruginosa TaxID=287 RepID=UPI00374A43DC
MQRLLERPAPFALLYRPESNGPGLLDVIRGEALELHGLADLPLDEPGPGLPRHDLLALIPYRRSPSAASRRSTTARRCWR